MSTTTRERAESSSPAKRRRVLVAATVSAVILTVAALLVFNRGDDPGPEAIPLELDAGQEDALASCVVFSTEELSRVAEVAFAGTVTSVDGERVTLTVDTWYRGGGSTEVVVDAPQGMEALIGGIPFETGTQYLISARDGTVNYCGFSAPSSPQYVASFDQAFAQG